MVSEIHPTHDASSVTRLLGRPKKHASATASTTAFTKQRLTQSYGPVCQSPQRESQGTLSYSISNSTLGTGLGAGSS